MRKRTALSVSTLVFATLLAGCIAPIAPAAVPAQEAAAAPADESSTIALPNGFAPEGIAIGSDGTFYTGSLAGQGIYKGDVATGEGATLAPGIAGVPFVGMKVDPSGSRLYVAGGTSGKVFVFDTSSGEILAEYAFTEPQASFLNDVTLAPDAAYFTDSGSSRIFALPLAADGALPAQDAFVEIPLSGEWQQVDGFNANGIAATADGRVIVVNSTTGALYTVDPATGVAAAIDLGGENVTVGDGILLDGSTLYVTRNRENEIAAVALADDLASGEVVAHITDPAFRVPTTVAMYGDNLFAVNARFGTDPGPGVDYDIVRVAKP